MNKKELLLQISIILVCLIVLTFRLASESTQAQMFCMGQPPTKQPYPLRETWPQGRNISVVVFDTPDASEFQTIRDAFSTWNAYNIPNCSGVIFDTPTSAGRPYVAGERIPDNTIMLTGHLMVNSTQHTVIVTLLLKV